MVVFVAFSPPDLPKLASCNLTQQSHLKVTILKDDEEVNVVLEDIIGYCELVSNIDSNSLLYTETVDIMQKFAHEKNLIRKL
jgi:hypothetical protein